MHCLGHRFFNTTYIMCVRAKNTNIPTSLKLVIWWSSLFMEIFWFTLIAFSAALKIALHIFPLIQKAYWIYSKTQRPLATLGTSHTHYANTKLLPASKAYNQKRQCKGMVRKRKYHSHHLQVVWHSQVSNVSSGSHMFLISMFVHVHVCINTWLNERLPPNHFPANWPYNCPVENVLASHTFGSCVTWH